MSNKEKNYGLKEGDKVGYIVGRSDIVKSKIKSFSGAMVELENGAYIPTSNVSLVPKKTKAKQKVQN